MCARQRPLRPGLDETTGIMNPKRKIHFKYLRRGLPGREVEVDLRIRSARSEHMADTDFKKLLESIDCLMNTIETDSNDVRDSEEQKMVSVAEQVRSGELQLDQHQVEMAKLIEASQSNLALEMSRAHEALPSLPDWKIHFLNVLLTKGTHAEVTRILAMNIFAPEQILPSDVQDPSKIIESLRESLRNEDSVDACDTLVDRLELYRASQRSSIVMLERFLESLVELSKD
ncbi:hypothetical protein C8J55DRAFT_494504 [Lentinula edodes]|uniref:Uncharacterized protein n=1 Tax=Lentinula lateritia TaxID=40482 RepID=A0A9W8ZP55_9AGAR|nr:hypothetical protein C8J55DRAFT_494504 [Lentinula edodes]